MALTTTTANYTVRVQGCELPAIYFTTGTWTNTRTSAGIYSVVYTATDATPIIEIPLSHVVSRINLNTSDVGAPNPSRGLRLMSVTVDYGIGVADLTAHTADIIRVRYNEILAPTVTTGVGGTLTPALSVTFGTLTTTGLHTTTQTLPTPVFLNPNQRDEELYYQLTIDMAATSTYAFHGVNFNFQIIQ